MNLLDNAFAVIASIPKPPNSISLTGVCKDLGIATVKLTKLHQAEARLGILLDIKSQNSTPMISFAHRRDFINAQNSLDAFWKRWDSQHQGAEEENPEEAVAA